MPPPVEAGFEPRRIFIEIMTYRIAAVLLLAALTGCQTAIDPATGDTQTRLTLPLTSANAAGQEEQWRRCTSFRSQSFCERNVPGGRPPGVPPALSGDDDAYPVRQNDP
jgi:hypothetical protein